MSAVDKFLQSPSEDLLDLLTKDQLLKVAAHYDVEVSGKLLKDCVYDTVKDSLVQLGVLPTVAVVEGGDAASASVPVLPAVFPQVRPVAGVGMSLTFEQQKELLTLQHKLELKREERAQERALALQAQAHAVEVEKLRCTANLRETELVQQREQQQFERYKLQLLNEGKMVTSGDHGPGGSSNFDVSTCLRLVPKFSERDPDTFFLLFERLARNRKWNDSEQTLLLQCVLTGRAQEAYSALSVADSEDYLTVKQAVLKAYELVPEAYRQKFRGIRKQDRETYVEFGRELSTLFGRWRVASDVKTFDNLCELILVEQFRETLPENLATYLSERGADTLSEAAVLADDYALTHKVRGDVGRRSGASGYHRSSERGSPAFKPASSNGKWDASRTCNYCLGKGHWKADCPVLRSKHTSHPGSRPVKPAALVAPVRGTVNMLREKREKSEAIAAVQQHTKPVALASRLSFEEPLCSLEKSFVETSEQKHDVEGIDPGYRKHVSDGVVSLVGSEVKVPVKILRDSGALDSFIVASVLPFSADTATGDLVLVKGMGLNVFPVPLHRVVLGSDLVKGEVTLAVRPALPVQGVQVILGNDLIDGPLPVSSPSPVVTSSPAEGQVKVECDDYEQIFPVCAVTRSQTLVKNDLLVKEKNVPHVQFPLPAFPFSVSKAELVQEQQGDAALTELFQQVRPVEEMESVAHGYFLEDDLLVRKWLPQGERFVGDAIFQIVVPSKLRDGILKTAHDMGAGHVGVRKTYDKVLRYFYWPRLKKDISAYIRTCHTCQVTGKPNQCIKPAPLRPISVENQPFEHLLIDCVGPLPKSKSGCVYLFTVLCQTTRYPAAFPLRNITTKAVLKALTQFMSVFGIPKIVQSDQGTNFTSKMFADVLGKLHVKHVQSTAYHPESQGAIERFHQTLKSLLRSYCTELGHDWEEGLPWLMLAAREVTQESIGFSPNDLVFGHTVRGPLAVLHSEWKKPPPPEELTGYVNGFKRRLYESIKMAKLNLEKAQSKMKRLYDRRAELHVFCPGDQVLASLPVVGSPFQAKFAGPYTVVRQVTDLNYLVSTPDRRKKTQLCHVNMLKPYFPRVNQGEVKPVALVSSVGGVSSPSLDSVEEKIESPDVAVLQGRLSNSESLKNLDKLLGHLPAVQGKELSDLILSFPVLFSDTPSRTHLIEHDIDVGDVAPIRQRFYRFPQEKQFQLEAEVKYMLEHKIAEPSCSSWASPCVLVGKPDKTFRPCTDFRKVNNITKPDSYPLPRMEDCVDQVGAAKYVSKFDLLKGYWQVPLSKRAQDIAAFITPSGLYSYTVMPFGLRNAPATFQRLMNRVVAGLKGCAVYLDDVVIYSETWAEHVDQIRALFERLAWANLTINIAKCEFAKGTVTYLGKVVGQGQVCPVRAKVIAIDQFPTPTTKKELMRFLGMVGYYRGFCKNFSTVVVPLTNLLRAKVKFDWSPQCELAFVNVKNLISSAPVLAAPRLGDPFQLQVDASNLGTGAALLQAGPDGIEHPVGFFSRKFNSYQLNYSIIEKEALALIWALQHFEVYVGGGRTLVVYTDHNPLTFLHSLQNPNQRLMRWCLFLQPFNLDIRHIKGSENIVADALSRA